MDKNNHLISKYLEGELNPIQTKDFEKALIQDHELKEELDLRREVDEALADTEVLDLRAQLNEIHEELRPQIIRRTRQASKRVLRYAVAASVAVIISLGTYTLFFKTVNNNKIVSQFYKPYDVTLVNRSANEDLSGVIRNALFMYENQEYREAIGLFEQILDSNPKIIASHFYSGVSYLEIEEFNNAGISFSKVLSHNDNLYIEQAEWYLGMVFLFTDQKDKAKKQFQKIKNDDGYYSKKAGKILRKLKRNK